MVVLVQRKLIQALPNPPVENTSTFSSVTNDGHYISLRPLVNKEGNEEFPFEWAFAGTSGSCQVKQLDSKTVQQIFDFELDTNIIRNVEVCHRGPVDTKWETWPSGDVLETGEIFPFGADKEGVKFRELWQPIDSTTYLGEDKFYIAGKEAGASKPTSIALYANDEHYHGLVTVVGNFVQGFLHKKTTEAVSFIRAGYTGSAYEYSLKFGDFVDQFPTEYHHGLKKGDKLGIFEVIEA